MPLYAYQVAPLQAILNSIKQRAGLEFLLVFSRQSGKNEAIAHLLVYLLNLFQGQGGNMVFAAIGDGLGRGLRRLEERLDNERNQGQWRKAARPSRCILGQAAVVFISSHPNTAARGETADHLLVIDEMQDQERSHIEAVFTPMRAARNATAVYLGTTRTRHDALWLKKGELELREKEDGQQRVFWARPAEVTRENADYGRFLANQVARYGRSHPIIASEYYLEPLNGEGGLFPARRRALMRGRHQRGRYPVEDGLYIALLDVGGQDEGATDPQAQLENPARDYTVCTMVQLLDEGRAEGPVYLAVDVFVDQGSRHFSAAPGSPSLAERLVAYLAHWGAAHLVCDATGIGEGLADWLAARLGAGAVTPFKFTRQSKAGLGAAFISLVETGRFKYWADDTQEEGSDGWWFWTQAAHCTYDLAPGAIYERDLRWYVPDSARVSTAQGRVPIHDDRLLSAALVAEADRRLRAGDILLGQAQSAVVPGFDPLQDMRY